MTTDNNINNNLLSIPENTDSAIEMLSDGSLLVDLDATEEDSEFLEINYKEGHYENLVSKIDDEELEDLSFKVLKDVEDAEQSREDWISSLDMGLDMMGIKLEEKNSPFVGACSAHHPLLMENAVKFQSKASSELLPASGPVETKIFGEESYEREQQAIRIKEHMNYQILEEMTEYYPDTEKMLLYIALIGSGFKKVYYDENLERPASEFIPADQFIVPNNASDLQRAPYYAHKLYITKHELNEMFASGFYEKPENLGEPQKPKLNSVQEKTNHLEGMEVHLGDEDKVYTLYEVHCHLYLDSLNGDNDEREGAKEYELASPYIITIDADSETILGIRRNWKESDEKRNKIVRFVHYGFVPGFGFYCYGLIHLLGNLQLSLTSSLRSLVDAGQFANLQGGFKLKGVRIVDNDDPIAPGEFKEVESSIQDINKAIMRLPFGEPSQVLYQMLEFLDRKGQQFADQTQAVVADSTNYGPVGTTLALLDASTKFFAAVHKRLHSSQKQELRLIAQINAESLKEDGRYNKSNPTMAVTRKDYDSTIDVIPVSDPNISSNAQRIAKAQTVFEMARQTPEHFDMREIMKHVLINMDYDNVEKLLPPKEEAQPNDALTDIQLASEGKPIKAFEGQDHQSHIKLKMAFLQDPYSGGSPLMAKTKAIIESNIQEHLFLEFKERVKAMSQQGQTQVDPMTGQQDGQADAQAAQQVAQMNAQKAQQEAEKAKGENDKTGQAALLLAQAEMLKAQSDKMSEEFEVKHKIAQFELDKEKLELEKLKEIGKLVALDTKIAGDIDKIVVTKGLDAQLEQLKISLQGLNKEKLEVVKADMKASEHQSTKTLEHLLNEAKSKSEKQNKNKEE